MPRTHGAARWHPLRGRRRRAPECLRGRGLRRPTARRSRALRDRTRPVRRCCSGSSEAPSALRLPRARMPGRRVVRSRRRRRPCRTRHRGRHQRRRRRTRAHPRHQPRPMPPVRRAGLLRADRRDPTPAASGTACPGPVRCSPHGPDARRAGAGAAAHPCRRARRGHRPVRAGRPGAAHGRATSSAAARRRPRRRPAASRAIRWWASA